MGKDERVQVVKNERGELYLTTPDGVLIPGVTKLNIRQNADDEPYIYATIEMIVDIKTETKVELKLEF